jgi:hypothetical protein
MVMVGADEVWSLGMAASTDEFRGTGPKTGQKLEREVRLTSPK